MLEHSRLPSEGAEPAPVVDHGVSAGSSLGNAAFRALLQGSGRGSPAAGTEEALDEVLEPIDVSNLQIVEVLEGHGNGPGGGSGSPSGGRSGSGAGASVSMTVNDPTEISKPEADIEAEHGRGTAGWTKPTFDMAVPIAFASEVHVSVTLGFIIELAEEYTGMRGAVLRDHEQGHVQIGTREAQTHLVSGLDGMLDDMGRFTPAGVQGALRISRDTFVDQEEIASAQYDASDYPRMRQAYIGAQATIQELSAGSPAIGQLAALLDNFASWDTLTTTAADVQTMADEMDVAWGRMSEVDVARVQYNEGFASLVFLCRLAVGALRLLHGALGTEEEGETEGETVDDGGMSAALAGVSAVLDRFSWTPTI
jgi:hypothetical protein